MIGVIGLPRHVWGGGVSVARFCLLVMLACLAVVSGCEKEVYSNLTEREANEMMAVLMSNGIAAQKQGLGEAFKLTVDEADMLKAISTLNDKGYPKNNRASIGSVFQKSGIISSPFEERVRYIFALGEDVAQTLSEIDGVVAARVHIVLPEEPQLGQPVKPSSAAVFIKHEPNVDLDFFVPQIRRLVSSSIEGLDYAAVTVVLTEAAPTTNPSPPVAAGERTVEVLPGLGIREGDVGFFWTVAYGVGASIVVLLLTSVAGLVLAMRGRRKRRKTSGMGIVADPVLEPS